MRKRREGKIIRDWQAAAAGSERGSLKEKAAVIMIRDEGSRDSLDENFYISSSCPRSSRESWGSEGRKHWSADDLSSLAETSSRASISSKSSSSSSDRKFSSSRTCNSSRSTSSSSSRSGSRRSKRQISCIRTVFDDDDEPVGYKSEGLEASSQLNAMGLERFDNDTTSASEDEFRCSSGRLFPPPLSPVISNAGDNDRYQNDGNESFYGDGSDMFANSRKSTWRKLRHRRLLTNLFNFKSQSGSGLSSGQEPQTMLIDIHVLRSPGPIRLLVDRNESVRHVIELALQSYECQRRQPPLGRSHRPFLLYCQTPEFEAMDEKSCVGDHGTRHFFLYPKSESDEELTATSASSGKSATGDSPSFKSWVEKTLAEMQVWGSGLINIVSKNIGCLATSFFTLNFDSIMCAVLKALR